MRKIEAKSLLAERNGKWRNWYISVHGWFSQSSLFFSLYIHMPYALRWVWMNKDSILLFMTAKAAFIMRATSGKAVNGHLWTNIPKIVQDAFVAVEDKRFYDHFGFDPIRMTKAVISNLFSDSILQGGQRSHSNMPKIYFWQTSRHWQERSRNFFMLQDWKCIIPSRISWKDT